MKKKILAIGVIAILIAILVILTGCGNKENNGQGQDNTKISKNNSASQIKVGDYVNYVPDNSEDYEVLEKYSGHNYDQIMKQDNSLKWRVLKISNGEVELISDKSVNELALSGSLGYNNGVFLLNDIAKKLYSNSKLKSSARSINIEDIEDLFTDRAEELRNRDSNYGKIYKITSRHYPYIFKYEKNHGENGKINSNGIGGSETYNNELTTKDNELTISVSKNNNNTLQPIRS
ncbi:MAG: hypothetical protein IJK18_05450 [Clostridia bacterium]|nr:hypothetical protein [Clostridia bacterium]